MTDSMNWGLIIAGGGRSSIPVGGPQGRPGIPGRPGIGGNPGNPATGVGQPGDGDKQPDLPQGPIKGVFSRSTDESLRLFFDHDHYNQWQFTVDLVTAPFGVNGGHGGGVRPGLPGQGQPGGGLPRFDVQWIGRPFRPGLTSPSAGGHGLQPSDLGGKGPRAGGFGAPSARPSGDGS